MRGAQKLSAAEIIVPFSFCHKK